MAENFRRSQVEAPVLACECECHTTSELPVFLTAVQHGSTSPSSKRMLHPLHGLVDEVLIKADASSRASSFLESTRFGV